jgi:hypothetical protein
MVAAGGTGELEEKRRNSDTRRGADPYAGWSAFSGHRVHLFSCTDLDGFLEVFTEDRIFSRRESAGGLLGTASLCGNGAASVVSSGVINLQCGYSAFTPPARLWRIDYASCHQQRRQESPTMP